jgi:hypothetical protein
MTSHRLRAMSGFAGLPQQRKTKLEIVVSLLVLIKCEVVCAGPVAGRVARIAKLLGLRSKILPESLQFVPTCRYFCEVLRGSFNGRKAYHVAIPQTLKWYKQ